MTHRREALRILGAISATCTFTFRSDLLFGQHTHGAAPSQTLTGPPRFFSGPQFAAISRVADLILPETDTPGALAAGVPLYIDYVVNRSDELKRTMTEGLEWLDAESRERHDLSFIETAEARQLAMLEPLCAAVDRRAPSSVGERFFRAMKNLTADGYYTSKEGLIEELRYAGNVAMAAFPACETPEH